MLSYLLFVANSEEEKSGEAFRAELRALYKDHKVVSYKATRVLMYNEVDCEDNQIHLIYSGETYPYKCHGKTTPSPNIVNAEHTVPQSFFNKNQPMVTDLHHLISASHDLNQMRSNYQFSQFSYSKCLWFCKGLNCSKTKPSNPNDYSCLSSNSYWMPRVEDRGQVARMVLYFYTMYDEYDINKVGSLKLFLQWNQMFPPSRREKARNAIINNTQGNANPYILHPEWADRAWADKI